jgi:hypothetical protein
VLSRALSTVASACNGSVWDRRDAAAADDGHKAPTPVGSLDGGGDPSVPGAVGNSIFTRADKGDSLGMSGQRL